MKTIYKNSGYLLIGFSIMCIISSCKKEYLKPEPLSFYTPENTYTTPDALRDALVTCERNIRYIWYGDGAPIISQLIFSDVAIEGTTDKSGPAQNMNIQITPDANLNSVDHNRIGWFWDESYRRLKYANTVLAYIDVPDWDTTKPAEVAQRNALIGGAYFFRAYSFYQLVNCFGDVPVASKLYSEPKLDFQTVKWQVILKEMKKELEWAAEWVPDNVPKGQVTKGAVLQLLTKINLQLGEFDDAIESASKIIDGGVYHLMTDRFGVDKNDPTKDVIWDLHRPANKAAPENKEGIFYVIDLYGYQDNGDFSGGTSTMRQAEPLWFQHINTPNGNRGASDKPGIEIDQVTKYGRGIGRCRGTWYSTHMIWNNDPGDYRHADGNWMEMEDYVYNAPALKGEDPYYGKHFQLYAPDGHITCSDTIRCWYDWPYYKLYVPDLEKTQPDGGHSPWYVYRLAGTYLLRAEAYVWKGEPAKAAADINKVRERANAQPIDPSDVNIGTILDERARELYYEELRNVELTRMAYIFAETGKPAPTGKTYNLENFSKSNFWYDWIMMHTEFYNQGVFTNHGDEYTLSPYHVLWPIPQYAIDANTHAHVNQNVGYTGAEKNVPPLDHWPQEK